MFNLLHSLIFLHYGMNWKQCAFVFEGMGCFWGAERLFWKQNGVYSTMVCKPLVLWFQKFFPEERTKRSHFENGKEENLEDTTLAANIPARVLIASKALFTLNVNVCIFFDLCHQNQTWTPSFVAIEPIREVLTRLKLQVLFFFNYIAR